MGNDLTMEIIENKEIDRLQLKFSDRPAEEIRLALKKNGWNWSPKNLAWQRKLTDNALRDAKILKEKFFGKEKEQSEFEIVKETVAEFEKYDVIKDQRNIIKKSLHEVAHIPKQIDFTRDNYNKLFPRSRIETPVENVKLGEHQFEKLDVKERQDILALVYETLHSPDIVINEQRESVFGDLKDTHVYARSYQFGNKTKAVQSIIISIDDENVSISSHKRDISNIVNKIKTPEQVLYVSTEVGRVIEQHTQENAQSVVNPYRVFNSEPPNKLYNQISVLSNLEKTNFKEEFEVQEQNISVGSEKIENMQQTHTEHLTETPKASYNAIEENTPEQALEISEEKDGQNENGIRESEEPRGADSFDGREMESSRDNGGTANSHVQEVSGAGGARGNNTDIDPAGYVSLRNAELGHTADGGPGDGQSGEMGLKPDTREFQGSNQQLPSKLNTAERKVEIKITKGTAKEIREQCRQILQKPDSEITEADKQILDAYEGAGGLHEVNQSASGVLSEFYTPQNIIDVTWQLVDFYAPNGKTVLEPSAGTGRFARGRDDKEFTMHELDKTSACIAKLLHPNANVIQGAYQKQFFDENERVLNKNFEQPKYDIVIGNPPYGDYKDKYKGLGEGKEFDRYEEYFISKGLDALKDDKSILAMVVPSGFLNSGIDKQKYIISEKGCLLNAYRLPEGAFPSTQVGTDIVIFKTWDGASMDIGPDTLDPSNFKDTIAVTMLSNNDFFKRNPENILGEVRTRTNRFGKEESYVALPEGKTLDDMLAVITRDLELLYKKRNAMPIKKENAKDGNNQEQEAESVRMYFADDVEKMRDLTKENSVNNPIAKEQKGQYKTVQTAPKQSETVISKPIASENKEQKKSPAYKRVATTSQSTNTTEVETSAYLDERYHYKDYDELFRDDKTLTAEEFCKFYTGNDLTEEDYEIWHETNWNGTIASSALSEKALSRLENSDKYIQTDEDVFENRELFSSGNIYYKLNELEKKRGNISEKFYAEMKATLEAAKPKERKIEEVHIPALSNLSEEFTVSRLATREFYVRGEGYKKETATENLSLKEDFINWATGYLNEDAENSRKYISDWSSANISREDIPQNISWFDVVEYLDGEAVRARTSYNEEDKAKKAAEAQEKRDVRKEAAEKLFDRYIHSGLSDTEQKALAIEWNRRFNSTRETDYSKLPVAIDGMRTHYKNDKFILSRQQIKGVSYLTQKGNGILAYDVGVGKTAAGIVSSVSQMQLGRASRPLIVVPKAVYTKWCNDIKEFFPDIQLNELDNFSKEALEPFSDGNHGLDIPAGSISICTEQALQRIVFDKSSESGVLFDSFANLLGLTDAIHSENDRERARAIQKIDEWIGAASQAKEGYVFFERCGFDNLTVDEAHRFKNLFRVPRSSRKDEKGKANEFAGLGSGDPSKRAVKMFAMTQLVQDQNQNRNVFLLTATPFTNSPLEIYSMLAYVGNQALKERHIYDIRDFCTEFAQCSTEWSVTPKGDIKPKAVMKQFNNLWSLQNLLTQYIDKVDGVEAGVERPEKEVHKQFLELTEIQQQIIAHETERMNDPVEIKKGGVLDAMGKMRMACVSPCLLNAENYPEITNFPTADKLVESSPKLQFVCDTATNVWREKPNCGQVIYMPYGVKEISVLKEYLVKQGIPESAIGIISGDEKISQEKIDTLTIRFNDKDDNLKILIGSKKIAEGMDLNGNSIALYNTMLDWNPTESLQVEGRIWRQGNAQEKVHIVYPLMEDSIESFIMQKHDEKSSRINDVFNYKGGDALDVSAINPEDIKFDLIKDPTRKADFIIGQEVAKFQKEITINESRILGLEEILEKYVSTTKEISFREEQNSQFHKNLLDPNYRDYPPKSIIPHLEKENKEIIIKEKVKLSTVEKNLQRQGFVLNEDTPVTEIAKQIREKISFYNDEKHKSEKRAADVIARKEIIIQDERNKLAEKRLLATPTTEQIKYLSKYVVDNTNEKTVKQKKQTATKTQANSEKPAQHKAERHKKEILTPNATKEAETKTVAVDSNGNGLLFDDDIRIQHITKNNQKDISAKMTVLDIADPDKEKMLLSAEALKLSGGKIPAELKILKQDYLEKCSFLPPMKISDGKAHIYADIGNVTDELMSKFPTQATETEKQKTMHVELVISEQLLGSMTAAAMLHAKSKGKTPAFPQIQQMTDEYRDGMKRTFPEITDGEIEKTYKNAYKISAMSMSKSVSMQQSQSRGIDSY